MPPHISHILRFTDQVSDYLKQEFLAALSHRVQDENIPVTPAMALPDAVLPPLTFNIELVKDCAHIANSLADAYTHPCETLSHSPFNV